MVIQVEFSYLLQKWSDTVRPEWVTYEAYRSMPIKKSFTPLRMRSIFLDNRPRPSDPKGVIAGQCNRLKTQKTGEKRPGLFPEEEFLLLRLPTSFGNDQGGESHRLATAVKVLPNIEESPYCRAPVAGVTNASCLPLRRESSDLRISWESWLSFRGQHIHSSSPGPSFICIFGRRKGRVFWSFLYALGRVLSHGTRPVRPFFLHTFASSIANADRVQISWESQIPSPTRSQNTSIEHTLAQFECIKSLWDPFYHS